MSSAFKRIVPLLNRIVVRKVEPEAKTKSGILLQKPDVLPYGVILEDGHVAFDKNGNVIPKTLKVGDKVLLPEYGGLKVQLGEQELFVFRETDIVAKLE